MNQIVTKTGYNKDAHRKLYYYTMFRKSVSFYFMLLLLVGIGAFIIYNAVKGGKQDSIITSVMMVTIIVIITPIVMISRVNSNIKKDEELRKNPDTKEDIIETIIINKEKLSRKLDGAESVVISWKQVEAVYERENYFFFYLNGDQSLIVDKSKFVEGDSNTLIRIIEKYGPINKKGKSVLKRLKGKNND